ncbi:hypothetical protein GCM10009099_12450 [Caenispirillum bisanense]
MAVQAGLHIAGRRAAVVAERIVVTCKAKGAARCATENSAPPPRGEVATRAAATLYKYAQEK